MSTESSVKLEKKEGAKGPETQADVECTLDLNRWSTAVQSWVREFQRIVARIAASLRQFVQNDGIGIALACSTMRSESDSGPASKCANAQTK